MADLDAFSHDLHAMMGRRIPTLCHPWRGARAIATREMHLNSRLRRDWSNPSDVELSGDKVDLESERCAYWSAMNRI